MTAFSDRIEIVKKNPDIYPTFAKQYTDETVKNNSLLVECGDRSRFISYDDIYLQKTNMYSFSSSRSFDGKAPLPLQSIMSPARNFQSCTL